MSELILLPLQAAGLFDYLGMIGDFIVGIGNFLVQFVEGIVRLLTLVPVSVGFLTSAIGVLPSIFITFATATVTVCVIFIILGREHGGDS